MPFPIVDVSKIESPESQLAIAKEVTEACKQWGFLLIKGHGIPSKEIEEMFSLSKEFFSMPEEKKAPFPLKESEVGYMGSFQDSGKDDKMSMWFGGLPGTIKNNSGLPPFWYEHAEKVEAFKHMCHSLVVKLLVCFAVGMGLPDRNFFADAHLENAGKGNSLRMLMYPARGERPQIEGSRMRQHTDSGSVTLLFQEKAGLELLSPTGDWVQAPCIKDCILINLGDTLSLWSGNYLKATLHRVTFDGLPYDQERQSMAYFGAAHPDTVLKPIMTGQKISKYLSNGIEVEPGMTAGQLNELIMNNIYKAPVAV